jgi:alkaline phosphatase D
MNTKSLQLISCLLTFSFTLLIPASSLAAQNTVILFGSCAHQDKEMPILKAVLDDQRDAFVFLGDNIYGDTENMSELKAKYERLGNNILFQKLRATTPIFAIWDDHDYGENDAGKEYKFKAESKQIMLDFWQVPQDSERRAHKDGLYGSYTIGQGEQSVRLIMPDLRYERDDLKSVGALKYHTVRKAKKMGPYQKSAGSMLSQAQWKWLEEELKKPEPIKIIASSLQVLADFTGWEAWANFDDKRRLIALIQKLQVDGVLFVSGDTHWGEISKLSEGLAYPLWDITSSGLTEEWKDVSPNKNRVSPATANVNYGFIDITWSDNPNIIFGLKDIDGNVVVQKEEVLSNLSH